MSQLVWLEELAPPVRPPGEQVEDVLGDHDRLHEGEEGSVECGEQQRSTRSEHAHTAVKEPLNVSHVLHHLGCDHGVELGE